MKRTEVVKVIGILQTLCPTQKFDDHTPHAWALVLDDIRYEDAQQAIRTLYRDRGNDQEWGGRKIEADDIIREVRRIRQDRIIRHPPIDPPHGLTEAEYRHWLSTSRRRIADGEIIHQPALEARPMVGLRELAATLNSEETR